MRLLRAVSFVIRAIAMCLALQMSGVVHFTADLLETPAHHPSNCPDDDDGDCPPGCPSCHCIHVSPALPVPFASVGPVKLLPAFEVAWAPYDPGSPPSRILPPVYRPPRA